MSEKFGGKQQKGEKGESKLKEFGGFLSGGKRLLTPCGGGAFAQSADLPKNDEIQKRADKREKHHGDADGVDVHAVGQFQHAGSGGESADSYQKADAAESDKSAADALKNREEKAGPVDDS